MQGRGQMLWVFRSRTCRIERRAGAVSQSTCRLGINIRKTVQLYSGLHWVGRLFNKEWNADSANLRIDTDQISVNSPFPSHSGSISFSLYAIHLRKPL